MLKRLGFVFNADHCIGCQTCVVACKNENQTPAFINWRQVKKISADEFLSFSCNHCDNPECIRVCPERAFTKRLDGILQINQELCTGCQLCIHACPYESLHYNYETNKVSKCHMCYSRQDLGLIPACVEACPTNSIELVDLNTFTDESAVQTMKGFPDIQITKPSIAFLPVKERKRYFLYSNDSMIQY